MGEPGGSSGEQGSPDPWGLGPTPPGHRLLRRRVQLAAAFDPADPGLSRAFERGRALLRAWGPQVGAGVRVDTGMGDGEAAWAPAVPEAGVTAVLRVRLAGLVPVKAPVRVTWTADTPDRAGFAYEALPGHAESGRESFVVTRETGPEGIAEVWFTVTAYSRPAAWYARLGGPVTRLVQRRITVRYLRAMAVAAR